MKNIKLLHFLQTAKEWRANMCYITPLTNQELKEKGYKESMFNDYLYKFYNQYDAIIIDSKSREVTKQYGVPAEALIEIQAIKSH